jgi:hypothetical protein
MSDASPSIDMQAGIDATAPLDGGRWQALPEWLRPRDHEQPGSGNVRLITTTVLVFIGLLLAVATVHDVARQVHVNHRLIADLHTWRTRTGHDYHNLSVEQNLEGIGTREVVCGNTRPGGPKTSTQLCLIMTGPVVGNRRSDLGGYYLPAHQTDQHRYRYACFGTAKSRALCPR